MRVCQTRRGWLHVITSDEIIARPDFTARAIEIISTVGTAGVFHLRTRTLSARQYVELARRLLHESGSGAEIVINGRVDVARAAGAFGVQLGRGALTTCDVRRIAPELRVGRSIHNASEATEQTTSDWLILGHLFQTPSHTGLPGAGMEALKRTIELAGTKVIALGGISPDIVRTVMRAGAYGVAVMSGIWGEDTPKEATTRYLNTYDDGSRV